MSNEDYGKLALRVGLGVFMLFWGLIKFVQTDFFVNEAYAKFYFTGISPVFLYLLGIVQLLVGLALILGYQTKLATGLGGFFHLVTILATYKPTLLSPFSIVKGSPPHFFFFTAVPVLFAFIALWYVGPGKLSFDKK